MPKALTTAEQLNKLAYIEMVLGIGWKADYFDYVFWRPDAVDGWRAYAICSDWFAWATADCEEIGPEDLPLLIQCLADLQSVEQECLTDSEAHENDRVATAYLPNLYASRKRQLRPMRSVYEDKDAIGPRLSALFNAVGPTR